MVEILNLKKANHYVFAQILDYKLITVSCLLH